MLGLEAPRIAEHRGGRRKRRRERGSEVHRAPKMGGSETLGAAGREGGEPVFGGLREADEKVNEQKTLL